MKVSTIDLLHLGYPQKIAAYAVTGPQGTLLIETGPAVCTAQLAAGLQAGGIDPEKIRDVLVTHIHLDHAGGAGHWAANGATVYVHPRGARHLVDPARLLASAARLYGDRMDELWGRTLPAPENHVRPVADGEVVAAAGIEIEALATPGHAQHHHAYRVEHIVFVGDLAGIVVPGTNILDVPAVPPDFDLELWLQSIDTIRELRPRAIYLTHFGPVEDVEDHLTRTGELLAEATDFVKRQLDAGDPPEKRVESYTLWNRNRLLREGNSEGEITKHFQFNPPALSAAGIVRYLKNTCSY